ncbi:hypothetical protein WMF28_42505 [Sorangium sp. So ce590]
MIPWQARQDGVELGERFGRDAQRLDEGAELADRRWDGNEVAFLLDDELGHEAARPADTALDELARRAKVLTPGATGRTLDAVAGPAHGRHHEISGTNALHALTRSHGFRNCLVSQHEPVRPWRRGSVGESRDLSVRSAHADFEHAKQHVPARQRQGIGSVFLHETHHPLGHEGSN